MDLHKVNSKRLRLVLKAFMGGGAQGGGTNIPLRQPSQEKGTINNWYANQIGQLGQYVQGQPLLSSATQGAQNFWGGLPSTLSSLQSQFGGLPAQTLAMTGPLTGTMQGYLGNIIANQGALTPQLERDSAQYSREQAENAYGFNAAPQVGGLASEVLNRDAARQQRYAQALQEYQGAAQSVGGLQSLAQNLGTGLAQTTQGLQTGGLSQLLGVQQGNVGTFGALTNPILSYLSNLFGGNLQAGIAQAQVNQQGNIANQQANKQAISGAEQAVGSVVGGIAMSDERLKQKIRETGLKTIEGIKVKSWEYRTRPGVRYMSPTAQDVEKKAPEAVVTDPLSTIKLIDVARFPIVRVNPSGGG
jgi:hypothetical protein